MSVLNRHSVNAGTVANPFLCDSTEDGFRLCRELNRPIVCKTPAPISGEALIERYFPSGKLQFLNTVCVQPTAA